jgi:GMP synthase-like glutamine amidotransferase
MLLLLNNETTDDSLGSSNISGVPKLVAALRAIHIPFYAVSHYDGIHHELLDPANPMFKSITGIIISGSLMKLSKIVKDISKYVHILRYLQAFRHVPVLGLCFGAQLLVIIYGGFLIDNHVYTCKTVRVEVLADHKLFRLNNMPPKKIKKTQKRYLNRPRTRSIRERRERGRNKTMLIMGRICFSDIPIVTNRRVKPIAWVRGNTSTLAVAYEFERGRVYGSMFHPEYHAETYYILKNIFNPQ